MWESFQGKITVYKLTSKHFYLIFNKRFSIVKCGRFYVTSSVHSALKIAVLYLYIAWESHQASGTVAMTTPWLC